MYPASKIRILIVDDEAAFAWMLKIRCERTGCFEALTLSDPTRALETAREFQPELILLDVVMPKMDGHEVKERLTQDPVLRNIPVLMITASAPHRDDGGDAAIESGDDVILAKPIATAKILAAIERQLARVA